MIALLTPTSDNHASLKFLGTNFFPLPAAFGMVGWMAAEKERLEAELANGRATLNIDLKVFICLNYYSETSSLQFTSLAQKINSTRGLREQEKRWLFRLVFTWPLLLTCFSRRKYAPLSSVLSSSILLAPWQTYIYIYIYIYMYISTYFYHYTKTFGLWHEKMRFLINLCKVTLTLLHGCYV